MSDKAPIPSMFILLALVATVAQTLSGEGIGPLLGVGASIVFAPVFLRWLP